MDDEGFVPISVIAGFNRLQALTQDTDLIKEVSLASLKWFYQRIILICCLVTARQYSCWDERRQNQKNAQLAGLGGRQ